MADNIDSSKRSWTMAQVKSKDTSIEMKVRRYLFAHGFRYRKNDKRFPGKPDIVLPKYKTVIFIHGCFWHRHPFCKNTRTPKSNIEFWENKFDRNIANDKKHYDQLTSLGWHVIILWECELSEKTFDISMCKLVNELNSEYLSFD